GFPGLHCLTKPLIGNCQLFFCLSSSCSLPQEGKNEERLQREQANATDEVPLVGFPDGRLPVQHHTAGRKVALLKSPPVQGTPIEHVGVGASNNRNVLRFLTVENPHSHLGNGLTDCSKAQQVAANCSFAEIHV